MSPEPMTPAAYAATIEAHGVGAHLTNRQSQLLGVLCRVVDPITAEADVSHLELALRVNRSTKTVARALADLAAAGWIDYAHGDRVGRGTTAVRVSRVRVWVETFAVLIEDGRRMVAAARRRALTATRARMRELLDNRARARRAATVDNLGGLFDLDRPEAHTRRSTGGRQPVGVHTRGTPPTGGVVTVNGPRPWDDLTTCPHDQLIGRCGRCKRDRIGSADAQTTDGGR